jgi:hypothetical protein
MQSKLKLEFVHKVKKLTERLRSLSRKIKDNQISWRHGELCVKHNCVYRLNNEEILNGMPCGASWLGAFVAKINATKVHKASDFILLLKRQNMR